MNWFRVGIICLLISAIGMAIAFRGSLDIEVLEAWIRDAGVMAPVLFMLMYAVAAVLFLPGSLFTLAGGVLFGPVLGTFYNLTGATLGAAVAFLLSRYIASDWVSHKVGGRLARLIDGVESEGFRFVAFVRLVPLFPFNLLNYALGLTRISFWHYLVATYLFMLPGTAAYTYLGYAGKEAIGGGESIVQKIMFAVAFLALVGFLPRIVTAMRRGRNGGSLSGTDGAS